MKKFLSRSFLSLVAAAIAAQCALTLPQEALAQEDSWHSIFYRPGLDDASPDESRNRLNKFKNSDGQHSKGPATKYGRRANSYAAMEASKFHKNDKPEYLERHSRTRSASAGTGGGMNSDPLTGSGLSHHSSFSHTPKLALGSGLLLRTNGSGSVRHGATGTKKELRKEPASMFGLGFGTKPTRGQGSTGGRSLAQGRSRSSGGGFGSMYRSRRPL